MSIFKKKTTVQIEERAARKQRIIDERLRLGDEKEYQEQLRLQRNMHAQALKKTQDDLKLRYSKIIKKVIYDKDLSLKEITTEKNKKINELFEEIELKNKHIEDNQLAWVRITQVMPGLITAVTTFRTEKEVKSLDSAAELSRATKCESTLEAAERALKRIAPRIEELLQLDEKTKHDHKKTIEDEGNNEKSIRYIETK